MRTRRQELQRLQENSMQYEDLKEKICTTCTRSIRGKIELKYSSSSTTDKIALSITCNCCGKLLVCNVEEVVALINYAKDHIQNELEKIEIHIEETGLRYRKYENNLKGIKLR